MEILSKKGSPFFAPYVQLLRACIGLLLGGAMRTRKPIRKQEFQGKDKRWILGGGPSFCVVVASCESYGRRIKDAKKNISPFIYNYLQASFIFGSFLVIFTLL